MTAREHEAVLSIQKVNLGYGPLQVVFDVSLEVGPGELIALVGGNGSGKSTILRAASGMIHPLSGSIVFNGERLHQPEPHQMAQKGLAHVPMGRQLFTQLSVYENLLLGAYQPKLRPRRKQLLQRVYDLFPDLQQYEQQYVGNLSGGQQQMVAIGRALMMDPVMLVMDEPSLGLAPRYVVDMLRAIRTIADSGLPILLVEQNIKRALEFSDRAYVLENGRLILEGPSSELEGHPLIRKAYLGL